MHGLCRALANAGNEVSIFTTNVDGANDSDVPLGRPVDIEGVKVWYFPSKFLRRLYWAPRMNSALREHIHQFDLVHLHSVFLWPTWAAARAARKSGVPYLVAPRGMMVRELIRRKNRWLKTAWIRLIERRNLEHAAGIHVTAPMEGKELERFGFNFPQSHYIPNGVDPPSDEELTRASSSAIPDEPYVLFLSRINWKKGLDRLVKAWAGVPDQLLVVAGNDEEGYQAKIEKLAGEEGVVERIRFIGPVKGTDKWLLYRNAQLFVLPSYSENFGIVVLEAMASGCPVAVTSGVGLADTVENERCGVLLDGTPRQMASAINGLLSDQAGRNEMGDRGRQVACSQFSWQSIARDMEQVYKVILVRQGANAKVCAP